MRSIMHPDYEYTPQSRETRKKRSVMMKAICRVKREHRARLVEAAIAADPSIVVRSPAYEDLAPALKRRAYELGISREALDAKTGLPDGYTGKLLGSRQVRNLGNLSMKLMLEALGLELLLVKSAKGEMMIANTKYRRTGSTA